MLNLGSEFASNFDGSNHQYVPSNNKFRHLNSLLELESK